MKTTSKYLGLFLVLVLALTLVGFQATSATAGDQKWTRGVAPGIKDQGRLLHNMDVQAYGVAADDVTIFSAHQHVSTSASSTGPTVYKSSNAGDTFAPGKLVIVRGTVGTFTAGVNDSGAVVAVVLSPDYATDKTIYVATVNDLYRSTDDGNSWGAFSGANAAVIPLGSGATITSMDVAKDAAGNIRIVIGTLNPTTGLFGEVWLYKFDLGTWNDRNVKTAAGAANTSEVLNVHFAPGYSGNGVLFATIGGDATGPGVSTPVTVVSQFSDAAWGANWFDTTPIATTGNFTSADVAFPADFDVVNIGKGNFYLGLVSSVPAEGDVFRITGRGAGSGFTTSGVTDLGLNSGVRSVAFSGNITGGTLVIGGGAGSSTVQRTTDVLSNTPVFTPSTKSPVGAGGQVMVRAAIKGTGVWATVMGAEGGFYKSTDASVTFNGTAFLQTFIGTVATPQGMVDIAVNPSAPDEMIVVTQNDGTANGTVGTTTFPASNSVWRTTKAGDPWYRVFVDTPASSIDRVLLSPTYSTDKTFYLANFSDVASGSTRIWRTSDNGQSFVGMNAPLSAAGKGFTAIALENATNVIVGYGNGEIQRSISSGLTWVKSITGAGTSAIFDILVNPRDAKESLVLGTSSGNSNLYRSTDNTASFRGANGNIGAVATAGRPAIALADGYNATTNPVVFLAVNTGIWREKTNTELVWTRIDTGVVNGIAVYPTEIVSATSTTAGDGIRRARLAHNLAITDPFFGKARTGFDHSLPFPLTGTITTKLLRAVTRSGVTTLYAIENALADGAGVGGVADGDVDDNFGGAFEYDVLFSYTDNLSGRVDLQLPRSKTNISDTDRLTFTWTGVKLPANGMYRTVVGFDYNAALDDVNQVLFDSNAAPLQNTTGTSFRLVSNQLEAGKTYFWYVQGFVNDDSGDTIASPNGRHTVGTARVIGEFTTGVAKPALISPMGGPLTGGQDAPLKPVLQWGSVVNANRYELQVDTSASFFAPFVNLTDTGRLDSTAYQIEKDLEYSTTYYWRVRAATFTTVGDWSTVGAFTTMGKPVAAAPPIVVQQQAPPVINIPAATTPSWVWVVIVIGAILVIVMMVLIVRTRRV